MNRIVSLALAAVSGAVAASLALAQVPAAPAPAAKAPASPAAVRAAAATADEAEVKRLASQARGGWGKEARTLSWFGLQDGMSVLELGSGPGFITEQLL